MKILIVEDEPSLCELMARTLRKEQYVVETASTFTEASERLGVYSYDCVLLDIMLPDGNGLRLLEELKMQDKRENVIIISARIRSVVRRSRGSGRSSIVLGNVTLDPEGFRVEVAGAEVVLLKKEFDILSYLMQRPGHMVDKAVLAEAVWGDHADQADNFHFVYSQMKNLRRKLEEAGATIEIKAVYGFGYKLSVTE